MNWQQFNEVHEQVHAKRQRLGIPDSFGCGGCDIVKKSFRVEVGP